MKEKLLEVLDEKAQARDLTAMKTNSILKQGGFKITGFVVTDVAGGVAIIDKSAVRWMTKDHLWEMMHG